MEKVGRVFIFFLEGGRGFFLKVFLEGWERFFKRFFWKVGEVLIFFQGFLSLFLALKVVFGRDFNVDIQ